MRKREESRGIPSKENVEDSTFCGGTNRGRGILYGLRMPATESDSSRDLRFDSVRGLMLVCMAINHLPSALRFLTDESAGVFSAAEGFVLLSGIVAGWVYTRRLRRDGREALGVAAWKRMVLIYRWQVAAFLSALVLVQVCAQVFGVVSENSPQLFYQNPLLAALLGVLLLHQPGLLDILPMYCAFVMILPYVLDGLESGRRNLVLGLSAVLWLAAQTPEQFDGATRYPIHLGSFNLFAWQFLFVAGIAIGHAKASSPSSQITRQPLLFAAAAAVVAYGLGVIHLHWQPAWSDHLFGIMLNKPDLGLLRLVDFAAAAYLIAAAGAYFPRLLTWRPFAFLGQHSLPVVAAQSVTTIVLLQFPALFAIPVLNWTLTGLMIALSFAAAAWHQSFATRPAAAGGAAARRAAIGK